MTEENKDTQDLKQGDDQSESQDSLDSEVVENTEQEEVEEKEESVDVEGESPEDVADQLLNDGTPKNKSVSVPYDKFQSINEKSKLFEQFSPVLSKLKDRPEVVDDLLKSDKDTPIEERLSQLEERLKTQERDEMRGVITEAISTWGDFRDNWSEIQPLVSGLTKSGLSYRDAVQRAYFAVNPEAAKSGNRLIAQKKVNAKGTFSSSTGAQAPVTHEESDEVELTEREHELAQKAGVDPKLYAKHRDFLRKFDHL